MMSKKTAINRIDLGMTRIAGYTLYDEVSREFQETTPKEVKDLISRGQVNGLKLVDGEIELDKDVFCMSNLMVKSAVGKYRTLYPTTSIVNCMYAVVRVIETDNGRLYEIINNKCARVKVTPEKLKILMEIGYVAGVKMGECGEIELCKGVTIEDKRTKAQAVDNQINIANTNLEELLGNISKEIETVSFEVDSNSLQDVNVVETEEKISQKIDDSSNEPDEINDKSDDIKDFDEADSPIDEASTNWEYTNQGFENDLSPEPDKEKKVSTNRKTRKK